MKTNDWLTLLATVVALFIAFLPKIFSYFDNKKKKKEAQNIIRNNLNQLNNDLLRIKNERNSNASKDTDIIIFDSTSSSEINGYYFLFSDLLLPNLTQFELSNYPHTIKFFTHYKIQIEKIRKESEKTETGALSLKTVNNLLEYLENAIKEFQ